MDHTCKGFTQPTVGQRSKVYNGSNSLVKDMSSTIGITIKEVKKMKTTKKIGWWQDDVLAKYPARL